jgi:hypothetical protein
MNPTIKSLGFVLFASLLAASPTSKPAAGADTSIAKDQYHFPAPPSPEWTAVKADPDAESITYSNAKHDGAIQMSLLPKGESVDPDAAADYAAEVIKLLNERHQNAHTVVVMQPKIEKDKRFAIVIHEKFKVGDLTEDELHIYKSVGPRVIMLAVFSVSDDADKTTQIFGDAKDLLDSVKFNRKAFKKAD